MQGYNIIVQSRKLEKLGMTIPRPSRLAKAERSKDG